MVTAMQTSALFHLPEKSSQLRSATDHHFLDNGSMFWEDAADLWIMKSTNRRLDSL
jgi:hypothetical protein